MRGLRKRLIAGPLTSLGIAFGNLLLLALGATWRVRYTGREHVDAARFKGSAVLYVLTHGVLLPLAYTHRHRNAQIMISDSRDGEIITRVIEALGYGVVRGSTTRGGGKAGIELVSRGLLGYDLGLTPDGPHGPRGSVSAGAVAIAARSGLPVVPVSVGANRAWRLRSWDRFLIPRPGARVIVNYQPAIRIAPGEDDSEAVEAIRTGMARAEQVARAQAEEARPPAGAVRIPA